VRFEEKKENVLGSGGYGIVFKGTFEGKAVAVKVLKQNSLNDKQEQKREMEEHPRLDHENVLKLLHVHERKSIFSKFYEFFQIPSWIET
jgi:serine/threonine protein kinase